MTVEQEGSRFRVPIEAFSAVTATVFVVSAVTNAAAFGLSWRLNYFLIATPADVVMSGFIATLWAGLLLCILAFVVFTLWSFWQRSAHFAEVFSGVSKFSRKKPVRARHLWFRVVILFAGVLSGILGAVGSSVITSIAKPRIERTEPFSYPTGLKVAMEANVPTTCKGGRVLWSGSSAVVLECTDNIRVLHNLDGFVSEPIRRKSRPAVGKAAPKLPTKPATPPPVKKGGTSPTLPEPKGE